MMRCKNPVAVAAVACTLFAGCSGSSGSGSTTRQRSSVLTVAAIPGRDYPASHVLNLANGALDLQTAMFSIDNVSIEENTGEGSGQNGGAEGKGENEGGKEGGNEGGENESEDIVLTGPFSIDIATGGAVLDSVPVFPGTFRQADLEFHTALQAPFAGHSIHVAGHYLPAVGSPIPFTLHSDFTQQIQVPVDNGGVTVTANTVMPIALTFDLTALFGDLDFASAAVVNGEILIDDAHNANLLAMFEANLADFVDLEAGDR